MDDDSSVEFVRESSAEEQIVHNIARSVTTLQNIFKEKERKFEQKRKQSELRLTVREVKLAAEMADWENEKTSVAKTKCFGPFVNLNIGGHKFTTTISTLTKYPDSMLGAMFSGRHTVQTDETGNVCIDKDGTHFRHILNFLRNPGELPMGLSEAHNVELVREIDFYGLSDVMGVLLAKEPIKIEGCKKRNRVKFTHEVSDSEDELSVNSFGSVSTTGAAAGSALSLLTARGRVERGGWPGQGASPRGGGGGGGRGAGAHTWNPSAHSWTPGRGGTVRRDGESTTQYRVGFRQLF